MPKKLPRTKGNTKPSSSSEAAKLLVASGHVASKGFIGFSNEASYVPASEIFDDAEASLDAEFRLVLRKLSKRDTVTKVKALQEFITLCASKEEADIKCIVPFWPRIYNKLVLDIDHKVRELAQRALQSLADRSGKSLAPHLKSIMGMWMMTMCDTYPTVSSAANTAFTSTFSGNKQREAIHFCRVEVIECLLNNILNASPATLSDPASTSAEDMESKYMRVVCSSLQSMCKLLSMLPAETPTLQQHMTSLLQSPQLWKHTKSTNAMVKVSCLKLICMVCQTCPEASTVVVNKISAFVISCLGSSDPILTAPTWEALLSLTSAHKDCWQHMNWQKAVWPKLKHVLETGCSGQARVIAPSLLPFYSQIPERNYRLFFNSFFNGICAVSESNNQAEISAFVQSYTECLQYTIKCMAQTEEHSDLKYLITEQLLTCVQTAVQKPVLSKSKLYHCLCPMLDSVSKIDPSTEKEFWSLLTTYILDKLLEEFNSGNQEKPLLFDCVTLLVRAMVFDAASSRVSFGEKEKTKTMKKQVKKSFSEAAEGLITDILLSVYQKAVSVNSHFMKLFKDVSSVHVPSTAADRLTESNLNIDCTAQLAEIEMEGTSNPHERFVRHQLLKLLWHPQTSSEFTHDVVLTILAYLSYVDAEPGANILSFLIDKLEDEKLVCQVIEDLLTHDVPASEHLFKTNVLPQRIETLSPSSTCVWAMMTTVINSLDNIDDNQFTQSCLDVIIKYSLNILNKKIVTCPILDFLKILVEKEMVTGHPQLGELVLSLLHLLLDYNFSDIWLELETIWLTGFNLVKEQHQYNIQMSQVIKSWVLSPDASLKSLPQVFKIVISAVTPPLSTFVDRYLVTENLDMDNANEICHYLYLDGRVSCWQLETTATPVSCLSYLLISLYNVHLLTMIKEENEWSTCQMQCLLDLIYSFALLDACLELKLKDVEEIRISELKTGIVDCSTQLPQTFNLIQARPSSQWKIIQYALELLNISSDDFLLRARLEFLSRCLKGQDLEMGEILKDENERQKHFIQCVQSSLSILLSNSPINQMDIADCLSGWMTFGTSYKLLDDEAKTNLLHLLKDVVQQLKDKDALLLSASDKSYHPELIYLNIVLADVLKQVKVDSSDKYWEFSLCILIEWIQFLSESTETSVQTLCLLVKVCDLAFLSAEVFSSSAASASAQTEWEEFFAEGVFSPLLPLFVSYANGNTIKDEAKASIVLSSLSSVVSLCPLELLLKHQIPASLTLTDTSCLPDNLKTLLNHLSPLVVSKYRSVQVAAFTLLWKILDELVKFVPDDDDEEEMKAPPEALICQTEQAQEFLECIQIVPVDEHVVMDMGTDEHAQVMGYLLLWRLLLQLFHSSPSQLRAKYALYYKDKKSVNHLLSNIFRVMPLHPSATVVNFDGTLNVKDNITDSEIGKIAFYVYRQCLEIIPALVRHWWAEQDRKATNFIDRFTTDYISSSLIRQQIISSQNTDMKDITILARPAAREVSATYEMAEVKINMSIVLPENFPLGKLEVTCDKRVGVSQAQWDRWLLQLNIFLQHQNGSISEGLKLWKGNLDKKFEGIDDCMICFSVIHGTNFQLPRLTCRTCRKKFHSACLYKWFNTSQKSSCPLCRNLF
ncbi:E3 ubiquitin-protein ligase listerin-like [Physella acuta]|uniref:E3 ubiquitin-protein ligase listerin-like n=1 Tax=Physella acuta TaxID=109671 RepID=UPI0027DC76A5|nr:E3 ubiquitin-protein ligase listerin-like [Physella acuta]